MNFEAYQSIAISLGLGLLVGLQREWKASEIAGIRTFPLITLLGTVAAMLGARGMEWLAAAGLLAVASLLLIGNLAKQRAQQFSPGMTSEAAALLMYCVGAALGLGLTGPAIVVGGMTAVLLQWKQRLHGLVGEMQEKDLRGIIHLVLIALVILPVLPDQTYGPYDVLNPSKIWKMVVLIVGISMAAYVAYRILGAKVGSILGGILGGLISSTATTVSYARQSRSTPEISGLAALVIMIASTIVNVRVLVEVGVVAPQLLRWAFLPIVAMLMLMLLECALLYFPLRHRVADPPEQDSPAQLKPAIIFGALYAVILFIVAAAKDLFGEQALYGVALISGLTDVDAITLSTANLFNEQRLDGGTAWRVILVATMSNLAFKAGAVALLGSRRLLMYVVLLFGIALAGGGALLMFWPDIQWNLSTQWLESSGAAE